MNIIKRSILFFYRDLWTVKLDEIPTWQRVVCQSVQRIYLTGQGFIKLKLTSEASALTYSTLLSIVPLLTLVFMISRGFGYNVLLEEEIRQHFSSQPQVVDTLIGFTNSYLSHTKSGIFVGFGILLLLSTLISLISGVERSFNRIWEIKNMRSVLRMLVDYSAMMFLVPIFFIVSIGLNIFITTQLDVLSQMRLLAPFTHFIIKSSPFLLMSLLFTALYLFIPNTRVRIRSAIIAGCIAGFCFQLVQYFYINSQIWMSSYNAIYGSFAALPLFMLWCQISWNICLFCAQLCYVDQNIDNYYYGKDKPRLSPRVRTFVGLAIMSDICKRFATSGYQYSVEMLATENKIPIRLVKDIVNELCDVGYLAEIRTDKDEEDARYIPARNLKDITVGNVMNALERRGDEFLLKHIDNDLRRQWKFLDEIKLKARTNDDFNKNIIDF